MAALFSKFYGKVWVGFCFNTGKRFLSEVSTERTYVLLKSGIRDYHYSPPFERSTCFYVTVSGNFERF